MSYKHFLITASMALTAVTAVTAQDDTRDQLKSYSFIEAQGGVQLTATDADMSKLVTPTAGVSFGHFFSPVVGARIHVNGWKAKSGFSDLGQYYKWNYVTPSADLMINLTNLVSKQPQHLLNVMLIGGIGLNYAWDNDELKSLDLPVTRIPLAWRDNRLSHNLRAALRLETDVTKALGLSLEVAANNTHDRFNSKTNDANDWQFTAMLGVSYRFKKSYQKPAPVLLPVIQDVEEDNRVDVANTTPVVTEVKKKPVVKNENLQEEIFYVVCKSDPTVSGTAQMKRVSEFMKKYKDARVKIVGYADKGTGTAKVNAKYARKRAEECKKALVEKYGCDASRIDIDSKGDTVQPFEENDKNRCVIVTGQGTFKVTTYEEVEVEKQTTKKVQKKVTRQKEVKEEVK